MAMSREESKCECGFAGTDVTPAGRCGICGRPVDHEVERAGWAAVQERDEEMDGLFQKYRVERVDGRDQPGDKEAARYFVLDYIHDRRAQNALLGYAEGVWYDNPEFAEDLWRELRAAGVEFKTIPERQAEGAATAEKVRARLVELYGPDEDKWPKVRTDGR